ncbi:hypothetical protein GCM10007160_15580 [Litchfieldella qijiaojingensis]|uniref:Uncharacterized protein n=1 Tax=Litchfieldella qijiaojingensis TaxID=980347 RepID=A0ABQ2YQF3_9GAMM|nr:hypothetical protein [Halomonas qijiaojingensis]GGX89113.1 hypothetical protein GCM10007160_15580 [Halomonas qijiaojingensis]
MPEQATTEDFLAVRIGKREVKRSLIHCNLDAIISDGYRDNSRRAVGENLPALGVWSRMINYSLRIASITQSIIGDPTNKFIDAEAKIQELVDQLLHVKVASLFSRSFG